jgi:carbon-monoxide dehydrogenase medium subunit
VKPPRFHYHDPRTVRETVALLGRLDNARLLAGGQSLMPMLNMRFVLPDHVIDLNRVADLDGVRETEDGLEIGAMTRQRTIEFDTTIARRCPLLAEAVRQVGHRQTRNRGTIGGSLCHLDPAAELVAVAATLDATLTIDGARGRRSLAFADFPRGYLTSALEPDELLSAVHLRAWPAGHGHGFVEFARRRGDFAIVSAAALLDLDGGGRIRRAALTLGGIGTAPVRMAALELAIVGHAASPTLFREASALCRTVDALDDVHAPASYRQHLAGVLSRRALELAHTRVAGTA